VLAAAAVFRAGDFLAVVARAGDFFFAAATFLAGLFEAARAVATLALAGDLLLALDALGFFATATAFFATATAFLGAADGAGAAAAAAAASTGADSFSSVQSGTIVNINPPKTRNAKANRMTVSLRAPSGATHSADSVENWQVGT